MPRLTNEPIQPGQFFSGNKIFKVLFHLLILN